MKLNYYEKLLWTFAFSILMTVSLSAQDTIPVPQVELDEIIATIDTLVEQDSINNVLLNEQSILLREYENLARQDSLMLAFKNQEIYLYTEQIRLYQERIKVTDKWYNKRQFGFIIGIATTVALIHTVGYVLP